MRDDARTPAQLYSLVFGAVLLLVGILGFISDRSFHFGSNINGHNFLGLFEVNGTHNIIHILSGLLGLALFRKAATARAYALGFGAVYALVTILGLIERKTVLHIIPINGWDNLLHLLIAALGILAGLASARRATADDTSSLRAGSVAGR